MKTLLIALFVLLIACSPMDNAYGKAVSGADSPNNNSYFLEKLANDARQP